MSIISLILSIVLFPFKLFLVKPMMYLATTRFRWIMIILVVLPMSMVFYLVTSLQAKIKFWLSDGPRYHQRNVDEIVRGIKANVNSSSPKKMCTARPSWTTMSIFYGQYKKNYHQVNLSKFINILDINEEKQTVTVEPLVDMGQITATLNPLGWTLEVTPELDDLTVGGLVAGFGVEAGSFKYGLFQYICESFEIVLANGEVVKCSRDNHPELFYNIPWSHGSLGFLTAIELRMIPAKKFVHLQYQPFHDLEEFHTAITEASANQDLEMVEALSYGLNKHVLMTGTLTDTPVGGKVHDLSLYHGRWFYKHVEQFLDKNYGGSRDEFIPLRAYYHRHTRSLFWEMEDVISFGDHPIFRYLLGWMMPPKVGFLKLTTNDDLHQVYLQKHVDQDLLIPISTLQEFLEYANEEFGIYPLWLCPCRVEKTPVRGIINPDGGEEMYIDVGIYGVPPTARPEGGETFECYPAVRRLEAFTRSLDGFQALYALTAQTRDEFEDMFDHKVWRKLRKQYHCEQFLPEIFDKVSMEARGEKRGKTVTTKVTKKARRGSVSKKND
jgi:delta24-sterol reductase